MISGLLLGIVLSVRTDWFHNVVSLPSPLVSNDFGTFIIIIIIIIIPDVIIVITVAAVFKVSLSISNRRHSSSFLLSQRATALHHVVTSVDFAVTSSLAQCSITTAAVDKISEALCM